MQSINKDSGHLKVGKKVQRVDWIPQGLSVTIKYIGKDFLVTENDEGIEGLWTNVDFSEWSLLPESPKSKCCGRCDGHNDICIFDQDPEAEVFTHKPIELMVPKLTWHQFSSITNPREGMIIQQKENESYHMFMNGRWKEIPKEQIFQTLSKK